MIYFLKLAKGIVKKFKGRFFILPEHDKTLTVSFDLIKVSSNKKILVRRNSEFVIKPFSKLSFVVSNNYQLFSLVSSFVPFFQHNDANRTLMGIGMQKQAVMLIDRESAIVNSGNFRQLIATGSFADISFRTGFVTFISDKKIVLKSLSYLNKFSITNKSFWYKLCLKLSRKNLLSSSNFKLFSYYKFSSSMNSYTSPLRFKKKSSRVSLGEVLTGDMVKNSTMLGIGKNLFLAYLSWKGYNFEDAIVINERLIHTDTMSSFHVKKYIIFLLRNKLGSVLI